MRVTWYWYLKSSSLPSKRRGNLTANGEGASYPRPHFNQTERQRLGMAETDTHHQGKECESADRDTCTPMITAALVTVAKLGSQPSAHQLQKA
jgi:hypothetical protein